MAFEAFGWFGVAASAAMVAGVALSTVKFTGMRQEPYSILNHFISELGDPRFAPRKTLFATTLVTSGALMLPFAIGIGLAIGTLLSGIVAWIGIFCAITCCMIGFVPEHKEKAHLAVASCFFLGIAVLMTFFTIAISIQPVAMYPAWVIWATVAVLAVVASFIVDTVLLPKSELARTTRPWDWPNGRPKFWRNPFLEWCSFFAMITWISLIAILALL
ncbi:MAG: DUF998 domain-containing protein [Candidatus Lokiarchaeota archaeon]|nr:DUF998 domain-containing protein [Candidatus Lokiarchaeota archaeon]